MPASRGRSYLKGLTSGIAVTIANIFVGLWLTPYTLRFLDRETYAVFALANDLVTWLGLLEIGLASVLNVTAAQLSGRPDQEKLDALASTTFFAQGGIAVGLLGIGLLISHVFPDFFGLSESVRESSKQVMALLALGSALTIATQTFSSLLIAHQQMHVDNAIRLALIVLRTGLTVVLLDRGAGLLSLAISHVAAVIITGSIAVWRVRRLLPTLSVHYRHFSLDLLRKSAGTGIWFSLGGFAGIMIMNLDRVMTAKIISVEMVTSLTLTGRLYALAWSVLQQVTNSARPALAQLIGQGRIDVAREKYHQLVAISTGAAVLVAAAIFSGNQSFVAWWVGEHNYGGGRADAFLALNLIVHCWVLPNRAILVSGLQFVPQNSTCRFIEGALNLGLSYTLGSVMGFKGIVLATSIAGILTSCWYMPLLTCQMFGLRFFPTLSKDARGPLLLIPIAGMTAFICRERLGELGGLLGAGLAAGVCLGVSGFVYFALLMDRESRAGLLGRARLAFVGRV